MYQWYKPINWKSIGPTFPDEIKIEIAKCETIEIGNWAIDWQSIAKNWWCCLSLCKIKKKKLNFIKYSM